MGSPRAATKADEMTYKQLSDVVNMVVTGNLPVITLPATTNTDAEYDSAIQTADLRGKTYLTSDGKMEFKEINTSNTKATISLYDSNSGDFSVGAAASVMTFNSNNALTIRDAKTDFFKTFDEIIKSV
jgi:flagellar hook-associated protein 3 FlgL